MLNKEKRELQPLNKIYNFVNKEYVHKMEANIKL